MIHNHEVTSSILVLATQKIRHLQRYSVGAFLLVERVYLFNQPTELLAAKIGQRVPGTNKRAGQSGFAFL